MQSNHASRKGMNTYSIERKKSKEKIYGDLNRQKVRFSYFFLIFPRGVAGDVDLVTGGEEELGGEILAGEKLF